MNIKQFVDEGYFARKMDGLDKEDRKKIQWNWLRFKKVIRRNLLDTGKISKITFNRFSRGWTKIFFSTDFFMPVDKFNELMGVKPVDVKYLRSSTIKIVKEMDKLKKEVNSHK